LSRVHARRGLEYGSPILALACLAAGALAPGVAAAAAAAHDARLDGTFAMRGTITYVDHVYGERRGQHVARKWVFRAGCRTGICSRVRLARQRSGRRITDVLWLRRVAAGTYSGTGHFWIALRCAGRVIKHGGRAREKIVVRVRRKEIVGTTPFATALSATYANPIRINRTACPGGIGQDAARYTGARASPLPSPPVASFVSTTDPLSMDTMFSDRSRPGPGGAAVVRWRWHFGDPSSPDDTSSQRNPSHRFTLPGSYTVTLEVTDGFGQSTTVSQQVTA